MRIVSLLPSLTEIVCELGLSSQLVGRSHECDFPERLKSLPACTEPKYSADGTSYQIDQQVQALVQEGLSVYRVDAKLLASLQPDLILTQDHCEVCAASVEDVKEAVRSVMDEEDVEILSVAPESLDDLLISIQQVSEALGAEEEGIQLIQRMIRSLNELQSKTSQLPAPRVVCLEWLDPLMNAGNWMPELVEIAGGQSLLGKAGAPSEWIEWEQVAEADPDLLLISPCGFSLEKTASQMKQLSSLPGWHELRAVSSGRVYLMDGHHYFHRPGPRLVDSAKIMAEIFHPGIFDSSHKGTGWVQYQMKE